MDRKIEDYDQWWYNIGSGMAPVKDEDMEEHANRVGFAAWSFKELLIHQQLEEAVRLLRYLVDIGERVSGEHWKSCTYGARNFLNTFNEEGDNDE